MALYTNFHEPTAEILQEAVANLHEVTRDSVKILSQESKTGTLDGENFTSVMKIFNIISEIDGEKFTDSLMAKMGSKDSPLTVCWEEMEIFPREAQFYSKLLPALQKLQPNHRLPFPAAPYSNETIPILMMENLKEKGFKLCEAKNGWTFDQMKLTLLELARFHATGYHLIKSYPGGVEAFKKDFDQIADYGLTPMWPFKSEEMNKQSRAMTMGSVNGGIDLIHKYLGDEDISARIRAHDIEKAAVVCKAPSGEFDVIVRSDCWSNNFMFKYDAADDQKITDVRFVDLQVCMRTRPSHDVAVLFSTSTTPELREKHFDELIKIYFDALMKEVARFGYSKDVYTFEKFMEDYALSMGYAFFYGILNLQVNR